MYCIVVRRKKSSMQMLDAAHRVGPGARITAQRIHVARVEPQTTRIGIAGSVRRGRPVQAVRADVRQGSRRVVAVTRSRQWVAIAGMNDRKGTLMNN